MSRSSYQSPALKTALLGGSVLTLLVCGIVLLSLTSPSSGASTAPPRATAGTANTAKPPVTDALGQIYASAMDLAPAN